MTKPLKLLYLLILIVTVSLWACMPSRLEASPSPQASSPTPPPSLTSTQASPTVLPTLTPTIRSNSSLEIQDSITIWKSFIGVRGQEDHLIFHVVTENASLIPKSLQIVDAETGQTTDVFPLQVSPFPNLCAAEPRRGKSYYRTQEVFFKDLPPDFWKRLSGSTFTYLIELEQPVGEQGNIALTEKPASCTNLVE